jgi:GntR family transcriptional regulator / MocR family aminotransferase
VSFVFVEKGAKPGAGTLGDQIFGSVRERILNGDLAPGTSLPSSRGLAAELGVSRNTVNAAYSRLEAEGFIATTPSSGSIVAEGAMLSIRHPTAGPAIPPVGFPARRTDIVDFRSGLPDLGSFPYAKWLSLARRAIGGASESAFGYG